MADFQTIYNDKEAFGFTTDFEKEHLLYELTMLDGCYKAVGNNASVFANNVIHEAFCIHAYNIMNFLFHKDLIGLTDEEKDEIIAYTDAIRIQIITLSKRRTADNSKKINWGKKPRDHDLIIGLVNRLLDGSKYKVQLA